MFSYINLEKIKLNTKEGFIMKIKYYFGDERLLLKTTLCVAALWIAAQMVLIVCFWGASHQDTSGIGLYIAIAQRCFENGQWYPMAKDVYSLQELSPPLVWGIWNPGYINYLILQLHVFGTVNFNAVLNLFLNIAMLFEVFYLGKKFFSKRTGLVSAIIFCLFYSNLMVVLDTNTENPFLFLCLSGLCLVFSGKWKYVIAASLLFALANWIRPLAIIYLLACALYFFITKAKFYNYAALIIPYVLALFIIGTITHKKIGYFVYQSTTSGYNLLATSYDGAKGNVVNYIFENEGGAGFIDNMDSLTFAQKDSIWKSRAFSWIRKHPVKFGTLFLKKIPALYLHDAWPFGWYYWRDAAITQNFFSGGSNAAQKAVFVKKLLSQALLSIPYYLTFPLFFYALWINRREVFTVKAVFLVLLAAGTAITCIFNVATRYHYPFIFTVIIYAAWGLDTLIEKNTNNDKTPSS